MKIFLLVVFSFPICIFSQDSEFKNYQHQNYSIDYPSNWVLADTGKEGALFVINPIIDENETIIFVENINLTVQNLKEYNLEIQQVKNIVETQISNMLTDPKIQMSSIITENGDDYHTLVAEGGANGMNFTTRIYTYLVNENLYSLTLVCSTDIYKDIKVLTKRIMDSFKLK